MSLRILTLVVVLGASSLSSLGCGKATLGRQDLEQSLSRHYIDLRWGRIPAAAQHVSPDLQPAFVEDWQARAQQIQIQDFDVVQIVENEDGETADVYVQLSWVESATMSLKNATLKQTWVKTDAGWKAAGLLELE